MKLHKVLYQVNDANYSGDSRSSLAQHRKMLLDEYNAERNEADNDPKKTSVL